MMASRRTIAPKRTITDPETLLTHFMAVGVIFFLKREKNELSPSHHSAEPEKTPITRRRGPVAPAVAMSFPRPMKMAENEIIVMGLARVRTKVEAKSVAREKPPGSCGIS